MGCTSNDDERDYYYSHSRPMRGRRENVESEEEEEQNFKDFEEIGSNFYYIINNYKIKYRWKNDWRRN